MSEAVILPSDQNIEAVLFERQRVEQERNPDIQLIDKVILKNGPRAFKVASHWVFVNRHTGEINHHTLRLETFRKAKLGWSMDAEHSLTLEDRAEQEVTRLLHFLNVVFGRDFLEPSGNYLIIPVDKNEDDIDFDSAALQKLLSLSQSGNARAMIPIIEQLNRSSQNINIPNDTLVQFLELSQRSDVNVLSRIISWFLKSDQIGQVVEKLEMLDAGDFQKLNTAIGLSALKNVLDIWMSNKENSSEEFWQRVFSQNSFVFAQIFAFPVVIIKDKAYVGGKGVTNTGGNVVDFLCANALTMNTALIEIKTPKTKVLGSQYRGDVYNMSDELSGSVVQVANYKDILTKSYHALVSQGDDRFEVFDPKCVVIIGNVGDEMKERKQYKSLELFRMGLKDVQVITYDELFAKIGILVSILEGENIV